MANIDFDTPQVCPECAEPMQVRMPIWITPGNDGIDVGNIDYESSNPQDADNWWCETCQSHHLPAQPKDESCLTDKL